MRTRAAGRSGRGATAALLGILSVILPVAAGLSAASATFAATPKAEQSTETLELSGLESKFAQVAEKASPCVVAISAACSKVDTDNALSSEDLNAQKLQKILGRTTRTVGTGFFIDADGYILTNEHVIADSEQLWITTDDRKVYPAMVIGSDPRSDLAVLKIPAHNMIAAKFGDGEAMKRGQWTIAIGNPYGLATEGEMAMSVGVVSALDRSLPKLSTKENRVYTHLIQTTAEINPGNSGGPLFNINGEVIGISTAVVLPQKQTNGIGFALPVNQDFLALVNKLKLGREVFHPYLGIAVTTPTARELKVAGVAETTGARVDSIEENSPASKCDVKQSDIVVSAAGQSVRDGDHLVQIISGCAVDRSIHIKLYREGKAIEIDATPRNRPGPSVAVNTGNQRLRWRGLVVGRSPANWTEGAETAGLCVVSFDEASEWSKKGIKQGAIIKSVAGKAVTCMEDLQQIINATPPENCDIETADVGAVASLKE